MVWNTSSKRSFQTWQKYQDNSENVFKNCLGHQGGEALSTFYNSDGKACSQGPVEIITPLPSVCAPFPESRCASGFPLFCPFTTPILLACNIYSVLLISCTVGMWGCSSIIHSALTKHLKSCDFLAPHILKGINLLHKEKFFVRRTTKHMTKFPFTLNEYIMFAYSGLEFLWDLFLPLLQVSSLQMGGTKPSTISSMKNTFSWKELNKQLKCRIFICVCLPANSTIVLPCMLWINSTNRNV